jgi:GTPase Era involved in 16S rRNA processing
MPLSYNENDTAKFAVVGHPNKGKSSIVSTLAQDQDIAISRRSGTTELASRYTVEVNGASYSLIDTPGFQRPTKVLNWLHARCNNASERAATVKQFVEDPECQAQFTDEVELLRPIVQGAAILYVVDGSRPYGVEYESEMEILRWTGQPSMALINPIENTQFIQQWENALSQYFKSVRVFNPLTADFDKQTELLAVFSYLNPLWTTSLNRMIAALKQQRQNKTKQSVSVLAELLEDLCHHSISQKVLTKQQAQNLETLLLERYRHWAIQREKEAIHTLLQLYAHNQTLFEIDTLDLPPNLFDCDNWYAWGLSKKQLVSAAAMAGAVSGATIDAMVAGSSFMLGTVGGTLVGATSAWFGADKLLNYKVKGLPLGGYLASAGPIKHKNFPYVIIGRFLNMYAQISQLNHADRRGVQVSPEAFQKTVVQLEQTDQRALHSACAKLVKQKEVFELEDVLSKLFN